MNAPAPEPKPKRSRRMVVWMVAVPIVILLLALAGANWKRFHLAYAKHLMQSEVPAERYKGAQMIFETHLRKGMRVEEVRRLFPPESLKRNDPNRGEYHLFIVLVEKPFPVAGIDMDLFFDDEGRLRDVPELTVSIKS